jgi:hypothetical protein
LLKLGYEIAEATVAKYMARSPGPPSQSWRTFCSPVRTAQSLTNEEVWERRSSRIGLGSVSRAGGSLVGESRARCLRFRRQPASA